MINMFAYALIAVLSINFFFASFSLQGVNRTVMSIPNTIFENATVTFDSRLGEDYVPYFDKTILNKSIKEYFYSNMEHYVKQYEIAMVLFNPETEMPCLNYCRGVRIGVKTKILDVFAYEKVMEYRIDSKDEI